MFMRGSINNLLCERTGQYFRGLKKQTLSLVASLNTSQGFLYFIFFSKKDGNMPYFVLFY